jgi:hypothetical protein
MPVDASTTVLGTLGIAVLLVTVEPLWKAVDPVMILVHEGGHIVVGLLTGNWIRGFIVDRTWGVTGFTKRLFWPSAVLVSMAGYLAAPITGLLLARGVLIGWSPSVTLGVLLLVLVGAALFHEGWSTLLTIAGAGAVLAVLFYRADPPAQRGAVIALAWILLLGGLRQTFSVSGLSGRQHRLGGSDQAVLEQLTAVHAHLWSLFFIISAVAALVTSARWLLL